MNKYFECAYCGNVINFHHIENNAIIACPACGGLFTEAKEIDNNRAKEILYENIKKRRVGFGRDRNQPREIYDRDWSRVSKDSVARICMY